MITGLDYWYDGQIRRYLEQIVKAFSGYQYMTGRRNGEEPQLRMVPCRMASRNRMVGYIINNNSENTLLTVPLITIDQTGLAGRRADVQHLSHVDTRLVHERAIDDDGNYTGASGNKYMVERMMPRPFEITVQVDIWTSNMDQKHQLMEQIMTVIYPQFSIQNSDNPLDWSAKTEMLVEDVTWSSKSVPMGTDNEIDIATITLKLPFWLNPPATVTKQAIVEQVVANIRTGDLTDPESVRTGTILQQSITTPGNHNIEVSQGIITLLGSEAAFNDEDGQPFSWETLLSQYGLVSPTISQIRLKTGDIETGPEIVGTIQYTGDVNKLAWQVDVDSLPANSFSPVRAIIDPLRTNEATGLPTPLVGHRYLLLNDIGPSQAWGSLVAGMHDIIQYDGAHWAVVFDASEVSSVRHVLNTHTGRQLRWTGQEWVLSIDGTYGPGKWRIHL
jgi:hypothetical protein